MIDLKELMRNARQQDEPGNSLDPCPFDRPTRENTDYVPAVTVHCLIFHVFRLLSVFTRLAYATDSVLKNETPKRTAYPVSSSIERCGLFDYSLSPFNCPHDSNKMKQPPSTVRFVRNELFSYATPFNDRNKNKLTSARLVTTRQPVVRHHTYT